MRTSGWEHRLTDLLTEARTRRFAWGAWDCCLFACAAIEALTGEDVGAAYRAQYDDEAGARRVLEAHGGVAGIASTVAAARGFADVPALLAQRGDVFLATLDGHDTLGVCVGPRVAFAVQPQGLVHLSVRDPRMRRAWRIA